MSNYFLILLLSLFCLILNRAEEEDVILKPGEILHKTLEFDKTYLFYLPINYGHDGEIKLTFNSSSYHPDSIDVYECTDFSFCSTPYNNPKSTYNSVYINNNETELRYGVSVTESDTQFLSFKIETNENIKNATIIGSIDTIDPTLKKAIGTVLSLLLFIIIVPIIICVIIIIIIICCCCKKKSPGQIYVDSLSSQAPLYGGYQNQQYPQYVSTPVYP